MGYENLEKIKSDVKKFAVLARVDDQLGFSQNQEVCLVTNAILFSKLIQDSSAGSNQNWKTCGSNVLKLISGSILIR